jgi:GTP diphosphokinase / guanosine-3',5'-bis(diphosphate) 3'-diphosphatase
VKNQNKLLRAAAYAAGKHSGQKRKGELGEPYINHPLEVANLLGNVGGIADTDVLIAAILHDVIEDCGVSSSEISDIFGDEVAKYVCEVTDDKTLPKQERKRKQIEHAPHLSIGAKAIKLADKISNITDISKSPPKDWTLQRRSEYLDWAASVVRALGQPNDPLERLFDSRMVAARKTIVDQDAGDGSDASPSIHSSPSE